MDKKERFENKINYLLYLLERVKCVIPTYYSDLIDEINKALKNNKN